MKLQVVIKSWYPPKPDFDNRFPIDWPHEVIPRIGEYIDVRPFRNEPKLLDVYRVDMVQYEIDGIYLCLTPTR